MTGRRHLGRKGLVAACSVAVGALCFSAGGFAKTPPTKIGNGAVKPTSFVPRSLSSKQVTVVVQLSGKSVAEAQADAGRKLSRAERQQIKAQLKATQDSLRGSIESAGGRVVNQFQSAIDGVKVKVAARDLGKLRALPGVLAVRPVQTYRIDNATSVPYIGTAGAWGVGPYLGTGVKIAVIDTGIDYTHANFGGPGTIPAFVAADATDTLPADPNLFGPGALTKVKGGYDFAGDAYNADTNDTPVPDPNPLDCNGHGSHVAGTAAGYGVTAGGATYTGAYNSGIYPWGGKIGPGVAPMADLYSLRVFGCEGTTNLVVDALDWAVDHDMDVINMSLGSPFGVADSADAIASDNAALSGVIVVASSGNEGPSPYVAGSPGTSKRVIGVAAMDRFASLPGFDIALTNPDPGPNPDVVAQNSNNATVSDGTVYTSIKYLTDNGGTPDEDESLGCSVAAFGGPLPANTLAVVQRGSCARVAKAIFGQQAGAAAVAMVNNATGYPPFEGTITSNPDDGTPFLVTIPFLGIIGPGGSTDDTRLAASATGGGTATVTNVAVVNPGYKGVASFSSAGPRNKDSGVKPDVTAPGVSIFSTASGTGSGGTYISGTSMASPHVAGVAALTREAHPSWDVNDVKAAIVNTATVDASVVAGYSVRTWGSGLVQPYNSVRTMVDAFAKGSGGETGLSYGFAEFSGGGTFSLTKTVRIVNHSGSPVTLTESEANAASSSGLDHALVWSSCANPVVVPASGSVDCDVRLEVDKLSVGDESAFRYQRGVVLLTPNSGQNDDLALRVPYIFVPRALGITSAKASNGGNVNGPAFKNKIKEKNSGGAASTSNFDWYAWGLSDPNDGLNPHDPDGAANAHDIRAVGVQSFPGAFGPGTNLIGFAINTWRRFSNAAENEWDIPVDVDNDGTVDYIVAAVDEGEVLLGDFNGILGSFVFSTRSPGQSIFFDAYAPTDGSTAVIYVEASQLCWPGEPCLSTHEPFKYSAVGFDLLDESEDVVDDNGDGIPDVARFNAWHPAMDPFAFDLLPPGGSENVTLKVKSTYVGAPFKGLMAVHYDDAAGADEADLVPLKVNGIPGGH